MSTTLPMTGGTYAEALALVLRSGSHKKDLRAVLSYFDPTEWSDVGAALDALVQSGKVDFDGNVYSLSRSK